MVFYDSKRQVACSPSCRCEVVPQRCVDVRSLIAKDTEHLFLLLLAIVCSFSLGESPLQSFLSPLFIGIFEFLLLNCKSFLHILCASLLSRICFKRTIMLVGGGTHL